MYLQRKNQHCIFILSVLFCSKTEKLYTLCSAGPSLGAKLGLPDEFSQKMFPITHLEMRMQAWDLETFQNSVLKSAKIRCRRKKSPAKFRQKIKTPFLGHEFFLLVKLKVQYFVQESAAKFTIFYLL
jgi:hypothetical protein